jgi:hypothetical protein
MGCSYWEKRRAKTTSGSSVTAAPEVMLGRLGRLSVSMRASFPAPSIAGRGDIILTNG